MHKNTKEQGLFELYRSDPDEADYILFGRETYPDRRGFLKKAGLAVMGAMVGAAIPFHRNIPAHFIPVALASEDMIQGKDGLTVLNDRPLNAETPPHCSMMLLPRQRGILSATMAFRLRIRMQWVGN